MRQGSGQRRTTTTRVSCAAVLAVLMAATMIAGSAAAKRKGGPLEWKQADAALLRVDDRPVAEWNLYQVNKKNDLLVLKMNMRFLLVDVPRQTIFELDPAKIKHAGDALLWDPDDRPFAPLETADWIIKDVGGAYRFSARLVAENHVIDVQIPHPLDLRSIVR